MAEVRIKGRRYSTDAAVLIHAAAEAGTALYRKRTGEYFLHTPGKGSGIFPLAENAALKWMELHGVVQQIPDAVSLTVYIQGDLHYRLKQAALKDGLSLNGYLLSAAEKALLSEEE